MAKYLTKQDLIDVLADFRISFKAELKTELKTEIRVEMDEAFATFYRHMNERFDAVDRRFDETDAKFDRLLGSVDAYAKQVEQYHHESIARDARVDRLEKRLDDHIAAGA